jgi:hypothetical protein
MRREERKMSKDALSKEIADWEGATKEYAKDRPSAWEHLGDLYREAEDWKEAIKAYTRAIELAEQDEAITQDAIKQNPEFAPDNASLYEKRGMAYERNNEIDKAMSDYKKAAKGKSCGGHLSFKDITCILDKNMADYKQVVSVKDRQLTKKIDWVTRLTIWGFIISVWGLIASVIGDVFGFECKISLFKLVVVVGGLVIGVVLEVVFKMWVWFNSRYNEQEPQTASKGET